MNEENSMIVPRFGIQDFSPFCRTKPTFLKALNVLNSLNYAVLFEPTGNNDK